MSRKSLERLLQRYTWDDLQHHVHVVRGDPGVLLSQMADQKEVDLLVMGTVRRTGIAGLLIGSTAEFALHQVECAVALMGWTASTIGI